ncbi:MAG: quinone-dependent dihydroorotate dehydrogenase [Lautropia sp.]|nr:quinone-dependent dihydroorotate dehydrogenase [Lautropia sp.]
MEHPDKLRAASYELIKPLLFRLPTETAHHLGLKVVDLIGRLPALMRPAHQQPASPIELMGLRFPNRIGLAAGLDKNAAHIDGLAALGFGFLELGTVTPLPQPGNPQPRLFRLPAAEALINRFGFNNEGLETFIQNVKSSTIWQQREQARQHGQASNAPLLGLNIGKNAKTPIESATEDYLIGLRAVMPLADYITINISSPNTANLRQLQGSEELDGLLGALAAERQQLAATLNRNPPLLVKIAPDLDEAQIEAIMAALLKHGIDGVIATNTTLSRTAVQGLPHAEESGGLSGRPVFEASNRVIRALRRGLPQGYPIIGVGGIVSAEDAVAKLQAGADLVQLFSGLIYRGPSLVTSAGRAVRQHLDDALNSDADARPTRASVP